MSIKETYEMPRVVVNTLCPESMVCASIPNKLDEESLFEEDIND